MQHSYRPSPIRLNRIRYMRTNAVAVLILAALAILPNSISARAEDSPFHRTGGGFSVNIGLIAASAIKGRPADGPMAPMPGGPPRNNTFHLVVAVFDAATKERIADAIVKARVSELGLVGTQLTLDAMKGADDTTYGGLVSFPSAARYVIQISVARPGSANAVFDVPYQSFIP